MIKQIEVYNFHLTIYVLDVLKYFLKSRLESQIRNIFLISHKTGSLLFITRIIISHRV